MVLIFRVCVAPMVTVGHIPLTTAHRTNVRVAFQPKELRRLGGTLEHLTGFYQHNTRSAFPGSTRIPSTHFGSFHRVLPTSKRLLPDSFPVLAIQPFRALSCNFLTIFLGLPILFRTRRQQCAGRWLLQSGGNSGTALFFLLRVVSALLHTAQGFIPESRVAPIPLTSGGQFGPVFRCGHSLAHTSQAELTVNRVSPIRLSGFGFGLYRAFGHRKPSATTASCGAVIAVTI